MIHFAADFFFSVLLDPLYFWHFQGVTSIAVAGMKGLLISCYLGDATLAPPCYRGGRRFSVLCHLQFRCTEAFLTACLPFLMKEICLVAALYAQLIKTTIILLAMYPVCQAEIVCTLTDSFLVDISFLGCCCLGLVKLRNNKAFQVLASTKFC